MYVWYERECVCLSVCASVLYLNVVCVFQVKNAMSSPSLQVTAESKTKADMPLSLVVGQETIKTALILLAVNPNIGGIVIAGGKGRSAAQPLYCAAVCIALRSPVLSCLCLCRCRHGQVCDGSGAAPRDAAHRGRQGVSTAPHRGDLT